MAGILRLFGKRKRSKELSESSEDDALTVKTLSLSDETEPPASITSSDEEAPSSSNNNSGKREKKGNKKWSSEITKQFPHYIASAKGELYFKCKLCNKERLIGKGLTNLKHHSESAMHVKAVTSSQRQTPLAAFGVKVLSLDDELKITASEMTLAYHSARHNFSLVSNSCTSSLLPIVFSDSDTAKCFGSAATKTTAYIKGSIYPYLQKKIIGQIENSGGFYSISMDAATHMDRKIYAICIRFYHAAGQSVDNRVLELESMPSGTAKQMVTLLRKTLEENGLEPQRMVAFTADNTAANFGSEKRGSQDNIFYYLKRDVNPKLIGVGCPSHISHNAAKTASERMLIFNETFDGFASKIYSHFSLNVIGKWMVILKNANLIEMRKLVGALLTVFASNAYCESIFSIAKRIWTPEKSNLHVDTLRALLANKCNTDVECTDMHDIFCADRDLLKSARTVAKYSA